MLLDIVRPSHRRARVSASASIPPTACSAGRRGLSAHVDGRQGRRLGRHAAARKPVEINALWYNALRLLAGWLRENAAIGDGARSRRARRARARVVQRALLVRRRQATCSTSSTASMATIRRCRPNQLFAISLAHPVLDRARWEPVLDVVRERLLTPVGLALARARASATTSRSTTAICARATPPIIRARCGPG